MFLKLRKKFIIKKVIHNYVLYCIKKFVVIVKESYERKYL